MQKVDDTITLEVKSRLNELFGEPSDEVDDPKEAHLTASSALKDLKSAVLSIDWEITDEGMNDLVSAVERLKEQYAENRIVLLFLLLLGSVAKYVRINKNRSHPQAFRILNTVFSRLEEVIDYPDLEEAQKKRYLYAEIVKFKKLKQKIASERLRPDGITQSSPQPVVSERDQLLEAEPVGEEALSGDKGKKEKDAELLTPISADGGPKTAHPAGELNLETLITVIEEIKEMIVKEFESLRAELGSLKKHRF